MFNQIFLTMKKVLLTVAGALLFGFAANAQTDSTYKSQSNTTTQHQSGQTQSQKYPYKVSDRETVQSSDIPASLRQTLGDSRYNGWENTTIYRDKTSNDYYFDLNNGSSSTQYRFDKNGKAIQSGYTKSSNTTKKSESYEQSSSGSANGSRSGSADQSTSGSSSQTTSTKQSTHKSTSQKSTQK